jgi:hypothetical protein
MKLPRSVWQLVRRAVVKLIFHSGRFPQSRIARKWVKPCELSTYRVGMRKIYISAIGHAVSREIVLCETLKLLAMSRIGSPASRRLIASACW